MTEVPEKAKEMLSEQYGKEKKREPGRQSYTVLFNKLWKWFWNDRFQVDKLHSVALKDKHLWVTPSNYTMYSCWWPQTLTWDQHSHFFFTSAAASTPQFSSLERAPTTTRPEKTIKDRDAVFRRRTPITLCVWLWRDLLQAVGAWPQPILLVDPGWVPPFTCWQCEIFFICAVERLHRILTKPFQRRGVFILSLAVEMCHIIS